jgi:hypothetical protein
MVLHEAPSYLDQIEFWTIWWKIFDHSASFYPYGYMLNKVVSSMHRSIIE